MQRSLTALSILLLAFPAAAQVYRCDSDGVPTFSDRPCHPDAVEYQPEGGLSFIVPDAALPELAESAQAFIRQRREELAERRRPPTPPPRAATQPPAPTSTVLVPWPVYPYHGHRPKPHGPPAPSPRPPSDSRYSALNGPILGTRRDGRTLYAEDRNHRGDRRR
jgi:hypothetical protein